MTATGKGKWVWVPDAINEPWQGKPGFDYSMRASRIYLSLVFKVPEDDIKFCLRHNLLPPAKLKPKQLAVWMDGARTVYNRVLMFTLKN